MCLECGMPSYLYICMRGVCGLSVVIESSALPSWIGLNHSHWFHLVPPPLFFYLPKCAEGFAEWFGLRWLIIFYQLVDGVRINIPDHCSPSIPVPSLFPSVPFPLYAVIPWYTPSQIWLQVNEALMFSPTVLYGNLQCFLSLVFCS